MLALGAGDLAALDAAYATLGAVAKAARFLRSRCANLNA